MEFLLWRFRGTDRKTVRVLDSCEFAVLLVVCHDLGVFGCDFYFSDVLRLSLTVVVASFVKLLMTLAAASKKRRDHPRRDVHVRDGTL